MNLAFREAVRTDLPRLGALYGELAGGAPLATPERLAAVFDRLSRYPDYRVWLALDEGELVGTYALCIVDTLGARCAPEGLVEDVAVATEAQGKGVGRAMMEHAMARCREAGCYKLVLSSNLAREGAHRFYEALGFKRHGVSFAVEIE
ncbi:MAG: GNAT family N-acetyltransferase [Thermoanaerobaculia bacterium]|nr:GNAT family N-acetyltransferase [Thermoanaerobaculia bacterium]